MRGQTLLLADDSVTTHRVVELTFAEHGLRVVSVFDGQQAIEKLATERPDIVLAAINMPKADGYEVTRFIKSQPAFEDVPVLLLRGAFDAVDDQRARDSGAAGVLVKPIESAIVINRVKELLGMRAKAAPQAGLAAGRLVTSAEPPPMRAPTAPRGVGAPAARPEPSAVDRPEPTARSGRAALAPPSAASARAPAAAAASESSPEDYFEKLDAAFDTLDAQLSGRRREAESTPTPAPVTPREPDGSPVYEADSGWFPKPEPAPAEPEVPPAVATEYPIATVAPAAPEDSPAPVAPVAPEYRTEPVAPVAPVAPAAPVAKGTHVADAFDAMLAAEQDEGRFHHAPVVDISDDVIERIASRVAERLSEGVFMDTVTHIVSAITERLVREEIARIRAAAQMKKP